MKICSIASGSSGNCIYVGSDTTHVLIDTGISKKRIEEGLEKIGIDGSMLSAIFITHEHTDHIQGLGVFTRRYQVPIYGTKGTVQGIQISKGLGAMPEGIYHEVVADEWLEVGDLKIKPFSISHDANEPTGYRLEHEGKAVAVATDLGNYDDYIVKNLEAVDALVLESNHDVHMVEVGSYPYPLKQRVLGEQGHLSNELSGRLLCEILHDGLKCVMLGHLSKDNNFPALAYETVKLEITLGDTPYHGDDIPIMVAERECMSEIIEV